MLGQFGRLCSSYVVGLSMFAIVYLLCLFNIIVRHSCVYSGVFMRRLALRGFFDTKFGKLILSKIV